MGVRGRDRRLPARHRRLSLGGMKTFHVYILASDRVGTLYVGVTGDIGRRLYEHRGKLQAGFTRRYGVTRLVYAEAYDDPATAIRREKQLKNWQRQWKLDLIEANNPNWDDLYDSLLL